MPAFDIDTIKADPRKLREGSWWKIAPAADGGIAGDPVDEGALKADDAALLIVPLGLAWERARAAEEEPLRDAVRAKRLTDDERVAINGRAMAKAVLRGWRGLTQGGQAMPYSEEKAAELLSSDAWRWLREFVLIAAQHRAAARAAEEEKAAGN